MTLPQSDPASTYFPVLTALGGIIVGGFIQFGLALLQHRRYRVEKTQALLLENKIAVCREVMAKLIDLEQAISPYDLETLSPSWTGKRERSEDVRLKIEDIEQRLDDMNYLIRKNEFILGRELLLKWTFLWGAQFKLKYVIDQLGTDSAGLRMAAVTLLKRLGTDVRTGIQASMGCSSPEVTVLNETEHWTREGFNWMQVVIDTERRSFGECI